MKNYDLYKKMKDENIYYINHELTFTRGAIAHYKGITAIVIDKKKVTSQTSENTVIMQELGHYMANAYYKMNSSYELIEEMEQLADIKAWTEFFPYEKIKELMDNGISTVTEIANYFDVEPFYMSRCLNYYYEHSNGFIDSTLNSNTTKNPN